jgi:hypothetical protein
MASSTPETTTTATAAAAADNYDDEPSSSSNSFPWSSLPSLLIVTAAVLLTNSMYLFQLAPARERLRITLLLWLTASLQHEQTALSVYETTIWCSLILQIAVQHILTTTVVGFHSKKKNSNQSQRRGSKIVGTPFLRWMILAGTNSLVWAACIALMIETVGWVLPVNANANTNTNDRDDSYTSSYSYLYSYYTTTSTSSTTSAAVVMGCFSWTALMLHQYIRKSTAVKKQRMLKQQQQQQQQYTSSSWDDNGTSSSTALFCCCSTSSSTNTAHTNANTNARPDERFWYTWTSRQVLEWMAAYQPPPPPPVTSSSEHRNYDGNGSDNHSYNYTTSSSNHNYATRDNGSNDDNDHSNYWNDDNDAMSSFNAVWISCLAAERLQGTHLDQLVSAASDGSGTGTTVADMRRDTGMPYGPAAALLQAVRDLTTRHERPMNHHLRGNGDIELAVVGGGRGRDGATASSSWLSQHDQEYGYTSGATTAYSHHDNRDNRNSYKQERQRRAVANVADVDPEMADMATKAQDLMKERFGLELPEIRQPRPKQQPQQQQQQQHQHQQQQQSPLHEDTVSLPEEEDPLSDYATSAQMNKDFMKESSLPSSASLMNFPPEFLANMPPHLAEIMRRKPELVQQILASRQKETIMSAPPSTQIQTPFLMQQQQSQSQPSALFATTAEQRLPRLGAVAEDEEEKVDLLSDDNHKYYPEPTRSDDDDSDDEWSNNNGEQTKLLRNRKRESSQSKQYKSIDR